MREKHGCRLPATGANKSAAASASLGQTGLSATALPQSRLSSMKPPLWTDCTNPDRFVIGTEFRIRVRVDGRASSAPSTSKLGLGDPFAPDVRCWRR